MHSMVKSVAKLLARGHVLNRRLAICLIQRSFLSSFYYFTSSYPLFCLSSISFEVLPARLHTTGKRPPFYQTSRHIPHQLPDIHIHGALAQSSSHTQWLTCTPIVCLVQLSVTSPCPSTPYMHVYVRPGDCT